MHQVALNFLDGHTLFLEAKPGELLLDAALRQGIKIPMDCREGVCATCRGRCDRGDYSQDYVDSEALSAAELAERRILSCQTRVLSDAAFSFDFDSSLCRSAPPSRIAAVVSRVEPVSDSSAILCLDASAAEGALSFLPGQYARLRVPGGEQWRAYSFAHAPGADKQLRFLVRLLPNGAMSNYLRDGWRTGDRIELEAPLGSFYLRHIDKPVLMLAGGTGLSAFLGMLDQLAEQGGCGQPVTLFYGVNREGDLCELPRLRGLAERLPGFVWHPVVMKPGEDWSGKRGLIPEQLDADALRAQAADIYLCGPPPMVDAMRDWLRQHGCEHLTLYLEKFADSGG
ncbi:anthranilate dioxygenase reductase [Chromobacterium sp. LK1]|uniref:anthranilate 1,2-dioxygenase electron transfer component AntC n=1 Tax=Chromobacterium sp. LK1 TaxID=1628193 RepID=UPI000653F195|nr:anthranilate 1,2-dioxygenase electron transfer component AntC [Chromobacterium sp. LK1]KMN30882.1 anthranilate dioxygenase reductase [Chromobacterium sp. LK1]